MNFALFEPNCILGLLRFKDHVKTKKKSKMQNPIKS